MGPPVRTSPLGRWADAEHDQTILSPSPDAALRRNGICRDRGRA